MSKKKIILTTTITVILIIIFVLVTWNRNDRFQEKNITMEIEISNLNTKIETLNINSNELKNKNEELESLNDVLNEVKKLNVTEIQRLLAIVENYEKEINDQKLINDELVETFNQYKHEHVIRVKNRLVNNLKLGLPKDKTLEILGADYQEVQEEEDKSWRFDLLKTDTYSYDDSHPTLDIEGMMADQVGIVVFINWTTENEIWYYTILYKNVNENAIWEYRVFANELIRETEIYKE